MATELQHNAYPNYSAGWDPETKHWSIDFKANLRVAGGVSTVIDITSFKRRKGDIQASFRTLEPNMSSADAAKYAAHALMEFYWPDPEEKRSVNSVVLVDEADGTRYEFEAPP